MITIAANELGSGRSKMQNDTAGQHDVVLKSTAGADVVIGLCRIEIPHLSPQPDREQHIDRRSDVDTPAELYCASASSSRSVMRSVDAVRALIEKSIPSARGKPWRYTSKRGQLHP